MQIELEMGLEMGNTTLQPGYNAAGKTCLGVMELGCMKSPGQYAPSVLSKPFSRSFWQYFRRPGRHIGPFWLTVGACSEMRFEERKAHQLA